MADAERMIERYTHGLALSEKQGTISCNMLLVDAHGKTKKLWHPVMSNQFSTTNVKLDKSRELQPIKVEVSLISLVPLNYKCIISNI